MTDSESHDAVVIGTGQAGKPLATALAGAGWKTAIIERDRVGGTCIINGCTPTKTMIASARVAYLARRAADCGVRAGSVAVDMPAVLQRKEDGLERAVAAETRGFMKAVVDADTDRILGAAILEGGEIVSVLQTAMMGGLPYTSLKDAVFAHPTFSESLNNLFMAMDR